MVPRFGSNRSLFQSETQQSTRSLKTGADLRGVEKTSDHSGRGQTRLRAISRVSWSSVFRGITPPPREQVSITKEFQQRLRLNSDSLVAILELVIILLSCIQLEISARSPRWRENRACANRVGCTAFQEEGSFAVPNFLRVAIGILGFVRAWARFRFLYKNRHLQIPGKTWLSRLANKREVFLEVLRTGIIPYPGIEGFIERDHVDILIALSIAVGMRSICWRQLFYFPYPIRQKEKVASFSGNLEFSYSQFVFKKVLEDDPLRKIGMMWAILVTLTAFLFHVIETVNGKCVWTVEGGHNRVPSHSSHVCASVGWDDAFWLVITTTFMIGYGEFAPRSRSGRFVIATSACVMRCLSAMLISVVIKKFNFSSMEARVNAFLFRMDLFNKKDLSAVMAVQASFRFNKSYKRSLKWHKHDNSLLYYRPLSARLPNEVKKKLYVSRFQACLKSIMKFNTDGDPLNSFTKHIEVITAALGVTLVEMTQLKRLYYRKVRILEDRRTFAKTSSFKVPAGLQRPTATAPLVGAVVRVNDVSSPRGSQRDLRISSTKAASINIELPIAKKGAVCDAWGQAMQRRCEEVLAQLHELEANAKLLTIKDRRSSFSSKSPDSTS